jgi:two-component system, NarL family, response regulator EvgA
MNEHTQSPHHGRRSVLLVDDHARVRASLALLLRWSGEWQIAGEAGDSTSALSLAATLRPDVVLLDRWLADGDGLCLVPRLQALARPPLVVLLTAEPDIALHAEALDLGIPRCLDKMMPPLELLEALRALI